VITAAQPTPSENLPALHAVRHSEKCNPIPAEAADMFSSLAIKSVIIVINLFFNKNEPTRT
jgi:hypothetical protein